MMIRIKQQRKKTQSTTPSIVNRYHDILEYSLHHHTDRCHEIQILSEKIKKKTKNIRFNFQIVFIRIIKLNFNHYCPEFHWHINLYKNVDQFYPFDYNVIDLQSKDHQLIVDDSQDYLWKKNSVMV